ncbi:hypothetical protein DFQ29_008299 [Apophysomyces sp. BC1021]|nr:hypothetical protein DFQ29_008299 [Apophysomyces sp. BC1021]
MVRRMLEEHGLGRWEEFKAKNKHWKAKCGCDPAEDNVYRPYHMVAAQPDFANQKTALSFVRFVSQVSL